MKTTDNKHFGDWHVCPMQITSTQPPRQASLLSQAILHPPAVVHSFEDATLTDHLLTGTDKWATAGPVRKLK